MIINPPVVVAIKEMCPCGHTTRANLHRIRRGWLMKALFFWSPYKRYNCYSCGKNKWIFDSAGSDGPAQDKSE